MNITELQNKLEELEVDPTIYSLNGSLCLDSTILYKNYSKWEVFYLNERGIKGSIYSFSSESDACEYLFKIILRQNEMDKKYKGIS